MFLFLALKNQLTGNFFGCIMRSGIALVLKWYLLVYRFLCLGRACSTRVRRLVRGVGGRRCTSTHPVFCDIPVCPKDSGHKKKRHRLFTKQALSRHGPENALP
jgi:hypothetical protein